MHITDEAWKTAASDVGKGIQAVETRIEKLASRLHFDFLDMDKYIEMKENSSVSGEPPECNLIEAIRWAKTSC